MRLIKLVFLIGLLAAPLLADELKTADGNTLVGTFDKFENGEVYFTTPSTGQVKISADQVDSIVLTDERTVRVRTGDDVQQQTEVVLLSRDGRLYYRDGDDETAVVLGDVKGIDEDVPDTRAKWDISALLTFSWTEGNTETLALGYRFDIKRETKYNFQHLFATGSYFQDRTLEEDSVRERKHHIGYLYRYIFSFRLTVDVTQDFYFNEFAGYNYRSITGLGPGYYILKQERLSWHVHAHLTYTYEDQIAGAEDRGYLGAKAGTDFDYLSPSENLHVNFKSEVFFDFDIVENIQWNSQLLVEYKFLDYFTAGLLVEHQWDNLPPPGFLHHDFRLTLTLGFSWSGRGF